MTSFSNFWEAAPYVAGGSLLAGGLARGGKNLIDLLRRPDPEGIPEEIKPLESPVASVPMEVTPEEAEELRRKGIKVKKRNIKQAKLDFSNMDMVDAAGAGALGTAGLFGGWKLTSVLIDKYRKNEAKTERDKVKARLQKVLAGEPDPQDEELYTNMKAAEASHFCKTALDVGILNALAALLGGTAVVGGMKAYNETMAKNPNSAKIKELKKYLKKRRPEISTAVVEPVEVVKEPVTGGSPAQQAAG